MSASRRALGVVIVTWNGWEHTRTCLESLRPASQTGHAIVVVDNGSTDGTPQQVRASFPGIEVLEMNENLGFTGGNNVGIRWCLDRGMDAVLILNNDTVVRPDAVDRMLASLSERTIVAPLVLSADGRGPGAFVGGFDWSRGVLRPIDPRVGEDQAREVELAGGCCLMFPRALFESVGDFDDDFFLYYEDIDLLVRAREAGFTVTLEPAAVIVHEESSSSGGREMSPVRLYYSTRNRLHFMKKHRKGGYAGFLLYFLAGRIVQIVIQLLRGRMRLAWTVVVAVFHGFAGRMGRSGRVSR